MTYGHYAKRSAAQCHHHRAAHLRRSSLATASLIESIQARDRRCRQCRCTKIRCRLATAITASSARAVAQTNMVPMTMSRQVAGADTRLSACPLSDKRAEMLCWLRANEGAACGVGGRHEPDDIQPIPSSPRTARRRADSAALGDRWGNTRRQHSSGTSPCVGVHVTSVAAARQQQGATKHADAPRPLRTVCTAPGGPPAEVLTQANSGLDTETPATHYRPRVRVRVLQR